MRRAFQCCFISRQAKLLSRQTVIDVRNVHLSRQLTSTHCDITRTRCRPGAARRHAPRRWQSDPKIAADLRPSADVSAVRTSLVAGAGISSRRPRRYLVQRCETRVSPNKITYLDLGEMSLRHVDRRKCGQQ